MNKCACSLDNGILPLEDGSTFDLVELRSKINQGLGIDLMRVSDQLEKLIGTGGTPVFNVVIEEKRIVHFRIERTLAAADKASAIAQTQFALDYQVNAIRGHYGVSYVGDLI